MTDCYLYLCILIAATFGQSIPVVHEQKDIVKKWPANTALAMETVGSLNLAVLLKMTVL